MKGVLAAFVLAAAYFSLLMPWGIFQDPDAFYHAHASFLLWHDGPLLAFPWLDLTTLGTSFADHHVLFHAIEAPFVAWLGWATGSRVTSILLSATFIATMFACLRWLGIRYASAWTVLVACSHPLATRLMLSKASPLAVTLFVLGMAAAWKRAPIVAFVAGALFALSHGGSVFLLGSVVLLACGDVAYRTVVEDAKLSCAIRSTLWREIIAVAFGIAFGTFLHPNFPENLAFLWMQVVKIGLGTPFAHVILGNEWLPSQPGPLTASFAPWIVALLLGLVGLLLAPRPSILVPTTTSPIGKNIAAAVIAFAIPVAALLGLTFKSRRTAEYLVPALALWIPWLWQMVDVRRLVAALGHGFSPLLRRIVYATLCTVLVAMFAKGTWGAYDALHDGGYRDDLFRDAMASISSRAAPGDRVFHSDWDEFPLLWNLDDRLRYVAGLDPTFLYEASSTLSDAYRDLTYYTASSTRDEAWDLIHDRLDARFVFVGKREHLPLFELLKGDARYGMLFETDEAATFEIAPNPPATSY